jgi:hypothetical protein
MQFGIKPMISGLSKQLQIWLFELLKRCFLQAESQGVAQGVF